MAKRVKPESVDIRISYGGGSIPKLTLVRWKLDDDSNSSISGYALSGNPIARPAVRSITASELNGTLQAFFDSIEIEIKNAEEIP